MSCKNKKKCNHYEDKSKSHRWFFMIGALILLGAIVTATTIITDTKFSQGLNVINNSGAFFSQIDFGRILEQNNNPTSSPWHRIYSQNMSTGINNTDYFTIRADTYSPVNSLYSTSYGFRNVVSRVNTYDINDIANFYGVWNDYAGSEGSPFWSYISEHECNSSFNECLDNTTDTYHQKFGYVVRFLEIQNGTNKIGVYIRNNDVNGNNILGGIAMQGNFTTGIIANPTGDSNYSYAFINANGFKILDSQIYSQVNRTSDYLVHIRNLDAVNSRHLEIIDSTGQRGVLAVTDGLITVGDRTSFRITANSTGVTCNSGVYGRMYFDNVTQGMYFCNLTGWNRI